MIYDYKCTECGFTDEYIVSPKNHIELSEPTECPKCKGKMERLFSPQGANFDIIGDCYTNRHGPKNYKKRMSQEDQVKVLLNEKDPY